MSRSYTVVHVGVFPQPDIVSASAAVLLSLRFEMGEFSEYRQMKEAGLDAEQIWAEAEASGVNQIVLFRMLKEVFGLSFPEAKAVCVRARTGTSLEEHAIRLCDAIENAVEEK